MGQTTMSLDERDAILAKIKLYREMMNEINAYTHSVPDWAKVDPFQKAQPQFDKALDKAYNASDKVREIESYLTGDGPWLKLDDATNAAFSHGRAASTRCTPFTRPRNPTRASMFVPLALRALWGSSSRPRSWRDVVILEPERMGA
jgi:hypothetical protein